MSGGVSRVRCVAVAADGSAMAVVAGGRLQVTDPRTRIPMSKTVKDKKLRHVALSPDGALLAAFTHVFSDEDPYCQLSVTETRTRGGSTHHRSQLDLGEEIRSAVQGLTFTAEGRLLYLIHDWPGGGARVDRLPLLRLMDPLTEECVGPPIAGPLDSYTRSVVISHDGTRAATADNTVVRVWHAPTGELLDTLALESIGCLAFDPGGHLLCLGNDGTLLHTVEPTKT
ncbi:WD40 repeat domain-containing protein [Streptomyces sp. NPDC057199]|uniref:WD40 repeat domain-containing protein n=1 Tax=Streptomyces sp. NPDC057199 TaxID=3346047 RepID=UPI00362B1554